MVTFPQRKPGIPIITVHPCALESADIPGCKWKKRDDRDTTTNIDQAPAIPLYNGSGHCWSKLLDGDLPCNAPAASYTTARPVLYLINESE